MPSQLSNASCPYLDDALRLAPRQHVEQRGLAGAAGAHQARQLAGADHAAHTLLRDTACIMQLHYQAACMIQWSSMCEPEAGWQLGTAHPCPKILACLPTLHPAFVTAVHQQRSGIPSPSRAAAGACPAARNTQRALPMQLCSRAETCGTILYPFPLTCSSWIMPGCFSLSGALLHTGFLTK